MKNNFLFLFTLFLGITVFSSCEKDQNHKSDDVVNFIVSERQLVNDYAQYSITNLLWETIDNYEVATFTATTKTTSPSISAWYKVLGEKAERQIDIYNHGTTVPDIIKLAFDKTPYADANIWTIEEIELENRYNNTAQKEIYTIELENVSNENLEAELYFNAETGKLLFSSEKLDDESDDDRYIVNTELALAVKQIYNNAIIIGASKDDDEIEVDVVVNEDATNLEIEMLFSLTQSYINSEYEVEYSVLPAKFQSVKMWIEDASNGFPIPEKDVEIEIIESNGMTIDNIKCNSVIEIEYEITSNGKKTEYEILFYLDAKNEIISVKSDGSGVNFGKYTNGTFILNQGNMSDGLGSLIFIDSNGNLKENVYKEENNESLPNLAADMFITNDNIYIISQMGGLIIADAHTLKKEKQYSHLELGIAHGTYTTHLAVINDNVFIRYGGNGSNSWIRKFNLKDKSSSDIGGPGATYVSKFRMTTIGDRLYASSGAHVLVLKEGSNEFEAIQTPGWRQGLSIIPSEDGNLWLSGKDEPLPWENEVGSAIMKMNVTTHEFEVNPVDYSLGLEVLADHPMIGAIENNIYFHSGQNIMCHNFLTKETKVAFKNIGSLTEYKNGTIFNGVGIDSVTKKLYLNTLKGFGNDYLTNDILVFDIKSDKLEFNESHKNKTRFPNGFHFTSQFKN